MPPTNLVELIYMKSNFIKNEAKFQTFYDYSRVVSYFNYFFHPRVVITTKLTMPIRSSL